MAADTDLQGIADELYSLLPGEFTAERNARAKEVRSSGDRPLAEVVAHLPKPSVAAWAANLLVRERGDQIGQVLSLGELLREAQEDLDPAALRTLTQQRRQLVAALGKEASRLASSRGQALSGPVVEELEQTLQAAMTDAAAADALQTGRLVRSLTATGLEVDLTDAVALPDGAAAAPRPAPSRAGPSRKKAAAADGDGEGEDPRKRAERERREREERERAERELAEAREAADSAEAEAHEAENAVTELERRRDDARSRREGLRRELRRLKAELAEVEDDASSVEEELEALEEKRDRASRAADRARLAAERAREAATRAEQRLR